MFLRVRTVRKFLGVSEIFLGVFEKKQQKDRAETFGGNLREPKEFFKAKIANNLARLSLP